MNIDKALRAAELGLAVFPFRILADGSKVPCIPAKEGGRGHLDASTDPERIREMFVPYSDALVGVHAGASGLVCADVDEKNGLSGSLALSDAWLDLPTSWTQDTPTGGKHWVYEAPEGIRLAPAKDYQGIKGLDIRGGSSWFGLYSDDLPESRDEFSPAPDWLCTPAVERVGGAFEGELDDWLATLDDDAPDGKVREAIERIPGDDFGHTELIERQFEFVRLGAEGHPGIRAALELLREAWLRGPYNTSDYAYEFDRGLQGAIERYGALEQSIATLPAYQDALDAASESGLDTALVFGAPKPKEHYFRLLRALASLPLPDEEIASVAWSAPTVKAWSREWGIEYLTQQIEVAKQEWLAKIAPRENPEIDKGHEKRDVPQPEAFRKSDHSVAGGTNVFRERGKSTLGLLTDNERTILAESPGFIDRYMAWVRATLPLVNTNYHRANAWTILSMAFGGRAFIPVTTSEKMGMGLYQMTLGESGTGKTKAITMRNNVLRALFDPDHGYNVGADNTSPQAFHEHAVARNGSSIFFNSDEAAGFFMQVGERGNPNMKLMAELVTKAYDGYFEPLHKKSAKEASGIPAIVTTASQFYSTPRWLFRELTEAQFYSGFLSRYQWSFGDPPILTEDRFNVTQARVAEDIGDRDPQAEAIANELKEMGERWGRKRPILGTDAALARLTGAKRELYDYLSARPEWNVLEAPYARLCDALHKATALSALGSGRREYDVVDVYAALEQGEIWVSGLLQAIELVSSSQFSREVEEIAAFVKAHPEGVTETRLYGGQFRRYILKDFNDRINAAVARGLIRVEESARVPKYRYNDQEGFEW